MSRLLHIDQMLAAQARVRPNEVGVRDLSQELTFQEWHDRSARLAAGLLKAGLSKGDRVAILAYNRLEWAEIYVAFAQAGLIAVPVNFRLSAPEIGYICVDCGVSAIIAEGNFIDLVETIKPDVQSHLKLFIYLGVSGPECWQSYEALLEAVSFTPPLNGMEGSDTWCLMYTSGTTGNPKGAIRNHESASLIAMMTCVELGFSQRDNGLLVMPMCHANSLYFFISLLSVGATTTIFSSVSFNAEECLDAMEKYKTSFTSLTPTHYIMLLDIPAKMRNGKNLETVSKLMISSATARVETKRAVMEMFPNAGLFELYGSTEASWVTMLHPDEQINQLGTVGREVVGAGPIKLLDEKGNEVPDGEPGELYSLAPYNFSGYWNLPKKTAEAFRGHYLTVGDIALRNADGYIKLIDRKKNMIITGGENVYPTEVEAIVGAHPAVKDVAVVGCPDPKWGDVVTAAVVLRAGNALSEAELIDWTKNKIAGFKRPRRIVFITSDEMPRNTTGKIMHRILRDMLVKGIRS
jgi:fatty-acyl-CoA synthase